MYTQKGVHETSGLLLLKGTAAATYETVTFKTPWKDYDLPQVTDITFKEAG